MPPKKVMSQKNKKRARVGEAGQSSNSVIEPNFELDHDNRYLFRNLEAFENFTGQFQDRDLCECYYFDKATVTFYQREDAKTIEYIQHWNWESLLNLYEPYYELTTRAFYANLVCRINPFRVTSWACGKEIELSFENLAEWLDLDNEGDETYLVRNWPRHALETPDAYKKWFNRHYISGDYLYVTHLPSLHRLLFLFINNILTPKSKIKTNMEHGAIYYLRHLIQLDDITLNIPYIIIHHMLSAFGSSVHHLPYAHLIHKIIRLNGTPLPSDLPLPLQYPQNLVNSLTKIGWIQTLSLSGLPQFKPDGRDINDWIFAQEALPNQYWDPEEAAQEPQVPNQPENQPQYVYQPMPMPQPGQEFPFPPIPTTPNEQIMWMCQRMQEQYLSMGRMEGQIQANTKAIDLLDKRQASLSNRFIKRFGASSSTMPFPQEGEEMDEENNEEEDARDQNQASNQAPNE
jgi:hypothetical protein